MKNLDRNREVFTKIWNAYRVYGNPQTDNDWEQLIAAMQKIQDSYDYQLTRDLINAVINEVERDSR